MATDRKGELVMRFMDAFTTPVGQGNAAFADGTLGAAIDELIASAQPEAASFTRLDGERAGILFIETDDAGQFTRLNEPLMAKLDAAIDIIPVQLIDELRRGLCKA